jgi:transcriptional regulator with XRE-family HTH domain
MIRLEEKYEQAVQFRKRGFTYSEIAKIVDVSVSTVSNWLAQKSFSKKVKADNILRARKDNIKRIELINKARSAERQSRYAEAVHNAETEYKHYKKDPLFVAGLMLYVGEGDKSTRHLIRIANADMEIHRIFIAFAKSYLGIPQEKFRFWILLYPNLSEKDCVKKWSKKLGLTKSNFHKNQVIAGKSSKRTLQYGIGNTIIGSTILKLKLNKWIELALKEL